MIHTFSIDLSDAHGGGNLINIHFSGIYPEQVKTILNILDFMMHRMIKSNDTYKSIVDSTIEEINACMQVHIHDHISCELSLNLQGPNEETRVNNFISSFNRNTMYLELSCMVHHPEDAAYLVPFICTTHNGYTFFNISMEKAEKLDWTPVLDTLLCSCRGCREGLC